MILPKAELLRRKVVSGLLSDVQLQPAGIDLTLREISSFASSGKVDLDQLSRPVKDPAARSWRGFNLFLSTDLQGLLAVLAGEHQISGLTS